MSPDPLTLARRAPRASLLLFVLLLAACSGLPSMRHETVHPASAAPAPSPGPTTDAVFAPDVAAAQSGAAAAPPAPRPGSAPTDVQGVAAKMQDYTYPITGQAVKPATEFDTSDPYRTLELRFQPLDIVRVQVWGYSELDYSAEVQANGVITLPLVGEVQAAGAAVEQLRREITARLQPYSRSGSTELREGDSVTMHVWGHDELLAEAVIDPEGAITFPLAGTLRAAGVPLEQIRDEAEQRLLEYISDAHVTLVPVYRNRRILYDPQVSVLAQHLEPRRIAVIGEVGQPGLIDIRGSLRVVEALAEARINEKTAKLNNIVVIRESPQGPQYKTVRFADYLTGDALDQNIFLQNKDIVIVPKSLITQVGDFVDLFLSRTAPVFTWWMALNQARVAIESADTVKLINESLEKTNAAISINPAVSP